MIDPYSFYYAGKKLGALIVYLFMTWFFACVVLSIAKTMGGGCETKWKIERVIQADWLCPAE